MESNFPPSDSCQPVLLPTNFASLCTFQKMMALNSIEMGIISFQLINGPLQRCLDDASPPEPGDVVFTICRALSCRLKCGLSMNRGRTHSPPCFQTTLSLKSLLRSDFGGWVFCLFFFLSLSRSGFRGVGHKNKTQVYQDQILYLF